MQARFSRRDEKNLYVFPFEKDVYADNDTSEDEINSGWINCDGDKEESEEWKKSKSL